MNVKINLNDTIKVKLTDLGREIFYHKDDDLRAYEESLHLKRLNFFIPEYPKEDEEGYTRFQLWYFMELYGKFIGMAKPNVIEPLNIEVEVENDD